MKKLFLQALVYALVLSLPVLDTAAAEEDDHHVFFRRKGYTVTTRGNMHVSITMDVSALRDQLQAVAQRIVFLEKQNRPTGQVTLKRHKASVDKLLEILAGLLQLGDKITDRQKRQLFDLFGIAGTILGAYNTYELHQLQGQVDAQGEVVNDLIYDVHANSIAINEQNLAIAHLEKVAADTADALSDFEVYEDDVGAIASVIEVSRQQTSDTQAIFDSLLNKRLSVKALTRGGMTYLLQRVQEKADVYGYEMLPRSEADAYQCEASFIITDDAKVVIFLHIPLSKIGDRLTVFEYLPIPIDVDENHHMSVHPRHAVIATDDKREFFVTMPVSTLATCSKLGAYYLCANTNAKTKAVRRTEFDGEEDDDLCPWFLLTQNQKAIATACPVHIHKKQSAHFAINMNQFVVVEKEVQQGRLACHKQEAQHILVSGPTWVTVNSGCTFETKNTLITGGLDIALNATPISYQWDESPQSIFADIDLEQLHLERIKANVTKTRVPRDVKDVREWMDKRTAWNSHGNLTASSVSLWGVLIAVIIGIILIGITCYCTKRKARLAEQAVPMGSNALTVFNPSFTVVPRPEEPPQPAYPHYQNWFRAIQ